MVELEGNLSLFHKEKLELTKIGAQRRRAVQRERKPGTLRVPGQSGLYNEALSKTKHSQYPKLLFNINNKKRQCHTRDTAWERQTDVNTNISVIV